MKVRAYAKALHYKEEEFHAGPTTATLEALISINNKLGLSEAASGILDYANRHHGTDLVSNFERVAFVNFGGSEVKLLAF